MSINYQLLKVRTDKLSFGLTVSGESCRQFDHSVSSIAVFVTALCSLWRLRVLANRTGLLTALVRSRKHWRSRVLLAIMYNGILLSVKGGLIMANR